MGRQVADDRWAMWNLLRPSALRLIAPVEERYYDRRLGGIETRATGEAGRQRGRFQDGQYYTPTPYPILKKIAGHLHLNPDDVVIDLGSGKGRVLCFLAAHHVKRIIGLELDPALVELAKRNVERVPFEAAPIEVFRADAAEFIPQGGTVFFLFHPFGEQTLAHVLARLHGELTRAPRSLRIVYYSPAHRRVLDAQRWLTLDRSLEPHDVLIWHHRP